METAVSKKNYELCQSCVLNVAIKQTSKAIAISSPIILKISGIILENAKIILSILAKRCRNMLRLFDGSLIASSLPLAYPTNLPEAGI